MHETEATDSSRFACETITRSWRHFVAVHIQRSGAGNFEEFIERNPDLVDRDQVEALLLAQAHL